MASSSSSPKPHNINKIIKLNATHDVQEVDEKAKAEERDLLELRLGRGFGLTSKKLYTGPSSSCSSFSLQQPSKQQHVGLDLGLGLGCYRTADRDHALPMPCSMPSVPSSLPFQLRPQPGLWFSLRSSPNRKRETMLLPQIPKMYIRVKDDKVTVLMVKTYLVTKLGLSNEAEIEISCKRQRLMSSQMLKHVRDTIWLPRLMESVIKSGESTVISISNGVPVNHLMCLDYERKC